MIRFVAAFRVTDGAGAILGALIVADGAPHAGLSAAQVYVLTTLAALISTGLELDGLRRKFKPLAATARWSDAERLRLLESVVVNANDAVLITEAEPIDLPGPRIVYCNAAFEKTTGYSEAEILGKTPRILQSPQTDRVALDRLKRALTRWRPVEVELLNHRKDGNPVLGGTQHRPGRQREGLVHALGLGATRRHRSQEDRGHCRAGARRGG